MDISQLVPASACLSHSTCQLQPFSACVVCADCVLACLSHSTFLLQPCSDCVVRADRVLGLVPVMVHFVTGNRQAGLALRRRGVKSFILKSTYLPLKADV